MIEKLIPNNSRRRRVVKKMLGRPTVNPYALWKYEQKDKLPLYQCYEHKVKPLISIVVPAFNTPEKYLEPLLRSITEQSYNLWELILVDVSSEKKVSESIEVWSKMDTRIRIVRAKNKGISVNTNIGIKEAGGEFIAFMDHDDVLERNALSEVVRVINETPDIGLIYSDEDKLSEDGSIYLDPHFKPDWSPHLLTHVNYITHFVVARKSLVERVGYLDPDKDGAQDYDFLLRLTDLGATVFHIPQVLYHWRLAENSTAADISNKPYVLKAGERALKDHFKRRNIQATASAINNLPGFYKAVYKPAHKPTVVITPFANPSLILKYMSVLKGTDTLNGYQVFAPFEMDGFEVIEATEAREYMELVSKLAGDTMVILNDFVLPEERSWASDLSGVLNDERVFAVSPAIVKTDRTVLDMGLVKQAQEVAPIFYGNVFGSSTPFGNTAWPRNVDELTGSVLAVRTNDFVHELKNLSQIASYSRNKPENALNVVWANTVMTHVKVPLPRIETKYFNANIHAYEDQMHLYANEQQIMDALIGFDLERSANE